MTTTASTVGHNHFLRGAGGRPGPTPVRCGVDPSIFSMFTSLPDIEARPARRNPERRRETVSRHYRNTNLRYRIDSPMRSPPALERLPGYRPRRPGNGLAPE